MTKPKYLLISDVRGWAFDQNMHDLEETLSDRFDLEHAYAAEWLAQIKEDASAEEAIKDIVRPFDGIFALYHRWGIEHLIPMERTLGTLRAQWMFPERKEPPGEEELRVVKAYRAYHVVTRKNYDEYRKLCNTVYYITNPVNMRRFPAMTPIEGGVIASWNGNAGHSNALNEDVKGFHSIVAPVCLSINVPLEYAEYNINRREPHEMPEFYQRANVALCASLYEGASSSVMEAMASGHAVIATDVGNHREMVESQLAEYGETGIILVDRTRRAFARALKGLTKDPQKVRSMGELNRMEIDRAWSWAAWKDRYTDFLLKAMGR
jgi:glycosyltransferase involved in cell wall biosynthesis